MVLRIESIQVRLRRLEEVVSELERLRDERPPEVHLSDRWSIERGLQLGAEILLDLGNHLLSAALGVTPESYEDIIRLLAQHGILSPELHRRLEGLGGFRNVLVHDYLRLDPARVDAIFEEAPDAYRQAAATIRAWVEEQERSSQR